MGGMPTALGGHAKRQEADMATQSRGHATLSNWSTDFRGQPYAPAPGKGLKP
jgi:hypothetical protein